MNAPTELRPHHSAGSRPASAARRFRSPSTFTSRTSRKSASSLRANEVLRMLALEATKLDLFGVLNDRTADGRDVSWVWDADWEIIAPHVRRLTCSGTRAAELALRLKYAGVDPDRLDVVDSLEQGLDRALANGSGPLYALPTYTALLELKDLLARRGHREYWR